MGMFDWVQCEVDLPDGLKLKQASDNFQTKSVQTTPMMDSFKIDSEGKLVKLNFEMVEDGTYTVNWNNVEETFPKYKRVNARWELFDFTGSFNFYTSVKGGKWHEYEASFQNGYLYRLVQIDNPKLGRALRRNQKLQRKGNTP